MLNPLLFTSEITMVTYITEVFKSKTDVLMTDVCLMIQVDSDMFLLDELQIKRILWRSSLNDE